MDGVIYVATGLDYIELAQASAMSLRHHNPNLPIDIFTNLDLPELAVTFDTVHLISDPKPRSKIDCMPLSRFTRTLYLDCDTLIVAPFEDLFDILIRFDLAIAHDMRRSTDLVQEGHKVKTPYAFPQLNSGVMLYRNSFKTIEFFRSWQDMYKETGKMRDQISLKDLLWTSDLQFYILPPEFNLRRVTILDSWEPGDARPTIIHSHRLMDHMQGFEKVRIFDIQNLIELERVALEEEWDLVCEKGERIFGTFSIKRNLSPVSAYGTDRGVN